MTSGVHANKLITYVSEYLELEPFQIWLETYSKVHCRLQRRIPDTLDVRVSVDGKGLVVDEQRAFIICYQRHQVNIWSMTNWRSATLSIVEHALASVSLQID